MLHIASLYLDIEAEFEARVELLYLDGDFCSWLCILSASGIPEEASSC